MRIRKNPELRVFKLRSGEEIIAKIAGKSKDKIRLVRPLKIMNTVVSDPFTGEKKQRVYFCDWLGCTTDLAADIPTDFIVVDLPPDPDMVALYDQQLEVQDKNNTVSPPPMMPSSYAPTNKKKPQAQPKPEDFSPLSDKELKDMISSIDKQMEDLYKQYDEEMKNKKGIKPPLDPYGSFPSPFGPPPPPQQGGSGIIFSFIIPQDTMNQWIESGVIDYLKDSIEEFMEMEMEDLLEELDDQKSKPTKKPKKEGMSKDKWKEPTDEQKKKPGFGNKHTDWSPYVQDYLKDNPPPPQQNKE